MTQEEICRSVKINPKTLRKWINAEKWDEERVLRKVTPKQLLQDTYKQMAALNTQINAHGGVPTKAEYDAKSILGKEIERLTQRSVAEAIQTFEEFLPWIAKNSPEYLNLFTDLSMRFINSIK